MDPDEATTPGAAPGSSPAATGGPGDAAAFFRQLGEQTSKVLTAAEEAAQGIREQARRDAAGILAEARVQADELSRAAASQRRVAEEELRRFREARTILANQIEDVHRRLEEIILRLRTPIDAPEAPSEAVPDPSPDGAGDGGPPAAVPASRDLNRDRKEEALPPERPSEAPGGGYPDVGERTSRPAQLHGQEKQAVAAPAARATPAVKVARDGVQEAFAVVQADGRQVAVAAPPADDRGAGEALRARAEALGEAPLLAGRGLKRLLSEDQNDLLDRIRRHRGRGSFEADVFPAAAQVERFVEGLRGVLEPAFLAGRRVGGGLAVGDPPDGVPDVVGPLVSKQVVAPLRRDLGRMIEPRLVAGDTATTVSERAGDVYRVWKGVRTELLGEGLVHAAFHQGLLDAWRESHGPGKRWVVSPDEADCPRDTCRSNAAAGALGLDASFPSGHVAPPAHGGCTCTLVGAEE